MGNAVPATILIMAENHAVYRLKPELQTPKGEEIPRS
jgi:hypothetical protein